MTQNSSIDPKLTQNPQYLFSIFFEKVQKKPGINTIPGLLCGTAKGTRTPDLLIRSQSLYPTELSAHASVL